MAKYKRERWNVEKGSIKMIKTYKFNRCGLVYVVIDKKGNVATSPTSHDEAVKHLKKRRRNA